MENIIFTLYIAIASLFLVYSPEREDPNNKKFTIEQLDNSLFKTKDTTANFILLEFSHEKIANKFVKFLYRNKITVRHLASYNLPKHVRLTIGNLNEMKKTIKVCNSFNV